MLITYVTYIKIIWQGSDALVMARFCGGNFVFYCVTGAAVGVDVFS